MKKCIIIVLISFVGTTLVAGDDALIGQHAPQKIQKNAPVEGKKQPVKKQSPRTSTKKTSPVIDKPSEQAPVQKKRQCPHRKKKIEPKKEVKKQETVPASSTPVEKTKQLEQKIEPKVVDLQKQSIQRTVKITHAITQDMITYHHWTGKHTPEFTISLNGKEIKSDQTTEIPVTDDKLLVNYTFNFAKGYYKDSKKVEIALPEGEKFVMQFSWKQTPNIIICKDESTQTSTKS
jgi:hypothetical protein